MTQRTRDNLNFAGKVIGVITGSSVLLGFAWANLAEPRIDGKIQRALNERIGPVDCQLEAIDVKLDVMLTDDQRRNAAERLRIKRAERGE